MEVNSYSKTKACRSKDPNCKHIICAPRNTRLRRMKGEEGARNQADSLSPSRRLRTARRGFIAHHLHTYNKKQGAKEQTRPAGVFLFFFPPPPKNIFKAFFISVQKIPGE